MKATPFAHIFILIAFLVNTFGPIPVIQAQEFKLPAPGQMVALSPTFSPVVLKGIKLDPKNPFRFHFYVDTGDDYVGVGSKPTQKRDGLEPSPTDLKKESEKLIKYFLASLTIPEKDLWVNLSPYEKDRIVPQEFGQTEMGRDLLAEDYLLKQITASIIYPESQLGKEFWNKVYAQAQAKYGTTSIPINTFNKVWIVPEKAVVYENGGVAFVLENHLKVMLEQDYLSMTKHMDVGVGSKPTQSRLPSDAALNARATQVNPKSTNELGSQIIREIVIPALTKEVNEGKNFAQLRQVFYSLILATWYKKKIKDSILNKVYSDRKKVQGLVIPAKAGIHIKNDVEAIYQQYLKAFKKGVYNYIKEESDPITNEVIPRKYFSGGVDSKRIDLALTVVNRQTVDPAAIAKLSQKSDHLMDIDGDTAMIDQPKARPFPIPVMLSENNPGSDELRSYLDRHYQQWKDLRQTVVPYLIKQAIVRSKVSGERPRLVVVDPGASTGEEMARIYHELMEAVRDKSEDPLGWDFLIVGLDRNESVVSEGNARLEGKSPFVRSRVRNEETQIGLTSYADSIMRTLNQSPDHARKSFRLVKADLLNPGTNITSFHSPYPADLILLNHVLRSSKSEERRNIIRNLSLTYPDSFMAIGDVIGIQDDLNQAAIQHVFESNLEPSRETVYWIGTPLSKIEEIDKFMPSDRPKTKLDGAMRVQLTPNFNIRSSTESFAVILGVEHNDQLGVDQPVYIRHLKGKPIVWGIEVDPRKGYLNQALRIVTYRTDWGSKDSQVQFWFPYEGDINDIIKVVQEMMRSAGDKLDPLIYEMIISSSQEAKERVTKNILEIVQSFFDADLNKSSPTDGAMLSASDILRNLRQNLELFTRDYASSPLRGIFEYEHLSTEEEVTNKIIDDLGKNEKGYVFLTTEDQIQALDISIKAHDVSTRNKILLIHKETGKLLNLKSFIYWRRAQSVLHVYTDKDTGVQYIVFVEGEDSGTYFRRAGTSASLTSKAAFEDVPKEFKNFPTPMPGVDKTEYTPWTGIYFSSAPGGVVLVLSLQGSHDIVQFYRPGQYSVDALNRMFLLLRNSEPLTDLVKKYVHASIVDKRYVYDEIITLLNNIIPLDFAMTGEIEGKASKDGAMNAAIDQWPAVVFKRAQALKQLGEEVQNFQTNSALKYKNAAYVPWPEVVSDPKQLLNDESPAVIERFGPKENRISYWANNQDVRAGFLQLVNEVDSGVFEESSQHHIIDQFSNLHTYLLVGTDGESLYKSRMFFLHPSASKQEDINRVKKNAGRVLHRDTERVDKRSERIFSSFKSILNEIHNRDSHNLEQFIDQLVNFYIEMIKGQDPKEDFLFVYGNDSLSLNMVNGFIRLNGLNGISHGMLENVARWSSKENLQQAFRSLISQSNPGIDSSKPIGKQKVDEEMNSVESFRGVQPNPWDSQKFDSFIKKGIGGGSTIYVDPNDQDHRNFYKVIHSRYKDYAFNELRNLEALKGVSKIPRVLEWGTTTLGDIWVHMQGIENSTSIVATVIQEGREVEVVSDLWRKYSFSQQLDKLATAAEILEKAHQVGKSHNDVTPFNIIINDQGEVMVIDWDIAAELGMEQFGGALAGSEHYKAPEVIKQDKSDVYSLQHTMDVVLMANPLNMGEVTSELDKLRNRMRNDENDRPTMTEVAKILRVLAQKAADNQVDGAMKSQASLSKQIEILEQELLETSKSVDDWGNWKGVIKREFLDPLRNEMSKSQYITWLQSSIKIIHKYGFTGEDADDYYKNAILARKLRIEDPSKYVKSIRLYPTLQSDGSGRVQKVVLKLLTKKDTKLTDQWLELVKDKRLELREKDNTRTIISKVNGYLSKNAFVIGVISNGTQGIRLEGIVLLKDVGDAIHLNWIAIAPWNRDELGNPQLKGVGAVLVASAIQESFRRGYQGRLFTELANIAQKLFDQLGAKNQVPYLSEEIDDKLSGFYAKQATKVIKDQNAYKGDIKVDNQLPNFAMNAQASADGAMIASQERQRINGILDEINKTEGKIFTPEVKEKIAAKIATWGLVSGRSILVVGHKGNDYLPILLAKMGLRVSVIDIDPIAVKEQNDLHGRFGLDIESFASYDELKDRKFDYITALAVIHDAVDKNLDRKAEAQLNELRLSLDLLKREGQEQEQEQERVRKLLNDLSGTYYTPRVKDFMEPLLAHLNPNGGCLFINDTRKTGVKTQEDHTFIDLLYYLAQLMPSLGKSLGTHFILQPQMDVSNIALYPEHLNESRPGVAYRVTKADEAMNTEIITMKRIMTRDDIIRVSSKYGPGGYTLSVAIQEKSVIPELDTIFNSGHGGLSFKKDFEDSQVAVIGPGPTGDEVIDLIKRYPGIHAIHIIDGDKSDFINLEKRLADLQAANYRLPLIYGYLTNFLEMPEELLNKMDLVIQQSVIDPEGFVYDQIWQAARQIESILKPGGVLFSAGLGSDWLIRIQYPGLPAQKIPDNLLKNLHTYPIYFSVKPEGVKANTGGIDLNPTQMNVQVKKGGDDFKFNFNGTEIDAAQVTGVTFTIRQMTPVTNLLLILGLNIQESAPVAG